MTRSSAALTALNRFGLGARPREAQAVEDPRGWLSAQLTRRRAAEPTGTTPPSSAEIGEAFRALRAAQRARDTDAQAEARRSVRRITQNEQRIALSHRVATEAPFVERLVTFWSNHLCVSIAGKGIIAPLVGLYEREVIRPHALGRFEEMVLASARHPAMLIYLDNVQSFGPSSVAGRRGERGLNENYARELLELHTLGVEGGYTQNDVTEVARALTGWTLDRGDESGRMGGRARRAVERAGRRRPAAGRVGQRNRTPAAATEPGALGFQFVGLVHEPGDRTVLGRRYPEGGEDQGAAIIRDLCRHPATARFLATKLARHFVSDDPPADAVQKLADAYLESEGDLAHVSARLITLDAAWSPEARKFRTPQDWLVAAARGLGGQDAPAAFANILRQLRQPLWAPPAPDGWSDLRRVWADPDALMNRAELARTIAGQPALSRMPARVLLGVADVREGSPLPDLLADDGIEAAERLALALSGPDFQWR